jgi:exopolyphosphatase/guanosine-5'-triphosphate,3'-diphosphate pyrophosphatase
MQNGARLAAVDLGSNSFRLEIGYLDHGLIHPTEYFKETVRQGNGMDSERNLSDEAMQRGWDCLARFGERLRGFRKTQVRAVATQTLREARNRDVFLARAETILGFPIEVIAGREEARLIYQGVSRHLPQNLERRLVIDIGGRSTELILGRGFETQALESYRVGSVAWSMRYFPEGEFTEQAFAMAEIAAKAVLDEALQIYPRKGWDVAYGASGTIGAVGDALVAAGWPAGVIDRAGLDWLLEKLLKAQSADRLRLEGMKEDRRSVISGGLSVLRALFDLLQIQEMQVAQGALRHGALYDLLDREHFHTDLRISSVERLAANFHADARQSQRVSDTALALLQQAMPALNEEAPEYRELHWAAQLHEIGNAISHSDAHKHGAYIIDNADATGFTMDELHRLSQLVLGHKGKLKKLEVDAQDASFTAQLMALRLAVILCHARREPRTEGLTLSFQPNKGVFNLQLPQGWASQFPQSAHLLREECVAWQKTAWNLSLQLQAD